MANTLIQIRRSTTTATPTSLQNGELAFSSNGDTLWIGSPSGSNTANVIHVGAKISYVGNATHLGATSTGSNTELASTYAIKTFVANQFSSYSTTLAGLSDVSVGTRANNDLLVYNSGTAKWENHTIAGTSNSVDVTRTGQNISVGLSTNVNVAGNVVIGGTFKSYGLTEVYNELRVEPQGELASHTVTNPALTITANVNNYTQLSIQNQNPGANSSADMIGYPNNTLADDNTGFIDMGITGNAYNQAAYSITGPNDGYVFVSARAGDSLGGSLVFATDSSGTNNAIKFFTNGFTSAANNPAVIIDKSQNVGIGVYAPTARLQVNGAIVIQGSSNTQSIIPGANVSYDLGSTTNRWLNVWANTVTATNASFTSIAGTLSTASQPSITAVGTLTSLTVSGAAVHNGNVVLGDASADIVSVNGVVNTAIIPSANITYDLGSSTSNWRNVYANTGNFVDVNVTGNLTVAGTLTTVDTQNIVVQDSLIRLARNQANTATFTDAVDIGFYGVYGNTSSTKYTGLARDSAANVYVLFDSVTVAPDNAGVNTSVTMAQLNAYLNTGAFVANSTVVNITANSSVSAALVANSLTLTTALTVGSGGSGRSTITAGSVMIGNNGGPVTLLSSSTDGHVLQITSGVPAFGGLDGGSF